MNFIYFLEMKNSLQRWRSNNKRKNYVRWHVWEHQLLSYTCQRTPGCRRAEEGVLYPLKKLYIQSWGKMKNVRHVFRKQNYVIFHFNIIYKHIHNVDFHFLHQPKECAFPSCMDIADVLHYSIPGYFSQSQISVLWSS